MMKNKKQSGLFDEDFRLNQLSKHGDPLEKLNAVIDWELFRPILNGVFKKEAKGPGGCPPFDYVMMFKILILQRLYNISDNQTEFQINDRLTFMRFLGLSLNAKVPDEKTIWHFRECLTNAGIIKDLFQKFSEFLMKRGILAKEGSIVDASFVDAPIQRNTREENKEIKQGKCPEQWEKKPNKLCQKDRDARWAVKYREKHYGYKNHVKIGKETKIMKSYYVSPANIHDSQCLEKVLDETDRGSDLHADSAYSGKKIQRLLSSLGIEDKIIEKGYRWKKLTDEQRLSNRARSKIRVSVEHAFGFIENSLKGDRIRTIGLIRANTIIGLVNLVYNMFRYQQILKIRLK